MVGSWLEYADPIRGHTRDAADIGLYILQRYATKELIKKLQTRHKEYGDGRMDLGTVSKKG